MSSADTRSAARNLARRERPRREARVVIRPIRAGDFFAWHDLFLEYARSVDPEATTTRALRVWSWLEQGRIEGFVAESGDRISGFVLTQERLVPSLGEVHLVVLDLVATPDARQRGVHDDLLAAAHARATERGLQRLSTFVSEPDDASQRYWRRVAERSDLVVFDLAVGGVA